MKSSQPKKLLIFLPEILLFTLVAVCFFWELFETGRVNYLMITCAAVLTVLVISKNKYLAAGLSVILGLFSFYFLFAVIYEFGEFANGLRDGLQLLLVGTALFGSLFVIAIFLPRKYFA